MIKMLINEEEVVSNKEFTINEEMLSTSSTILNNCYPKSWEDTKDYVNNFYYPLDYSKFKLEEGDFLHGNTQFAELNASGINPGFETNVEKEFKSIEIDGKSYQATSTDPVSPSPDYPSEVECVKGINLLKGLSTSTTDTDYWYSVSTPYFTPLEDGWGKLEYDNTSGTSTAFVNAKVKLNAVELKENTNYTLITEIRNSNISKNAGAFLQMVSANAKIAFQNAASLGYSNINSGGIYKSVIKTKESFTGISTAIDTYLRLAKGTKGTVEARISLFEYNNAPETSNYIYIPYGNIQISVAQNDIKKAFNIDLKGNELCGLPNNVKDELVIENGRAKIIKRVGKIILNGSERWRQNVNQTKDNTSYYYTYALDNLAKKSSQLGTLRSNYFINQETLNIDREGISMSAAAPYLRLRINTSIASTAEKLLTWLSTHNTVVYYELATPTEIDLGKVGNLSTFKGVNNVSLNATLSTNMNLVYYYKNYDLKFCGLVKNSGDISLNPRYPKYCSLQILDFKTLLSEGETLDFVINNKTIIQAIRMVISAISDYGFVEGNINIFNEDEEIGAYSTLNKTAYDVFQYLADISRSRWTTRLVDEDTIAIDFYDTTLMPKGKSIEYNSKYWEDNKVVDLKFNFGTRDYRNKQIMLSDEVYADIDYSEEVITDGYTTTFNLSSNIGSIYSISINGQEATFTTQINKKIGVIADFYYEVGKPKIESDDLLTSGKVIKVTYIPLVKGRQIVYNNDEVARVTNQIGRKGTISRYESRNDVLSSSELNSIGQTYIKYKGSAEIILNLKVEDNDIYNVGDVVYFDAPIQNLAKDYMVKRKSIDIINVNDLQKIFYTYELTSSFNSERDINYFDNQRNKATGNISEGDTIDRNIDIEDTANIIFYGLEINEIQVEGDNTLNSVLNSPFIN